ncbi:MAG: GGDEF domain-containing protein [Rubrivivax sp.]|nr:GGDEF domain-containing protein [Rubrivivax sp.]
MTRVVEHLAELTGYRDRDLLDVSLVESLKDLLQPQAVAIYRCVGEMPQAQHWITRARLGPGDVTATADPLWSDLENLPAVESIPDRFTCLSRQEAFCVPGPPAKTYFPLTTEHEVVGVLEFDSAQPLSTEDVRMVSNILRIYRNFQGLLDYSERDTLTGLLNRKTFDESFLRIAHQPVAAGASPGNVEARRAVQATTWWLGVIDIDHFKRVNDNFGHLMGDEVLLLLSRLMRTTFRIHDHLYRFGGEEFVALMRCGSEIDAAAAFERLRGNVERYVFPQVGRITVSAGFTELRAGDSPSGAFDRADKAIYYAKQHGRNQVRHHATLVAAGELADESRDSDVELF